MTAAGAGGHVCVRVQVLASAGTLRPVNRWGLLVVVCNHRLDCSGLCVAEFSVYGGGSGGCVACVKVLGVCSRLSWRALVTTAASISLKLSVYRLAQAPQYAPRCKRYLADECEQLQQ